ncbi:hypothetical protein BV20DRAFT_628385 [Pilatotrama ljubarskyi]|nr:hypothetical protein BV20DRAFT_628385 [Pilatotrama ljubarskyi]
MLMCTSRATSHSHLSSSSQLAVRAVDNPLLGVQQPEMHSPLSMQPRRMFLTPEQSHFHPAKLPSSVLVSRSTAICLPGCSGRSSIRATRPDVSSIPPSTHMRKRRVPHGTESALRRSRARTHLLENAVIAIVAGQTHERSRLLACAHTSAQPAGRVCGPRPSPIRIVL